MTFTENWFPDVCAQKLVELAQSTNHLRGKVIEVGSWEGRSTLILARAVHPVKVQAIDTWEGSPSDYSSTLAAQRDVYATFAANTAGQNIETHRMGWREYFGRHPRAACRFVFLDADHSYIETAEAIAAVQPLMVDGGILCGHDIAWDGVKQAVDTMLPTHEEDADRDALVGCDMTVWGVTCTRDEADILEASTRHMLHHCDLVYIEDHLSVDETPEILERLAAEYGERLLVTSRTDEAFEYENMVDRLTYAEVHGATWVVPFDTDEFWTGPPLREWLPTLTAYEVVIATVYEHVPELDGGFPAMRRRHRDPWAWTKCAARAGITVGIGHHEAVGRDIQAGEVRHFPYRTLEQARTRAARNAQASEGGWAFNSTYQDLADHLADPDRAAQWWAAKTWVPRSIVDPLELRCE